MKIYVPYGVLFGIAGPAGAFKTRDAAEEQLKQLDSGKIAEYELED